MYDANNLTNKVVLVQTLIQAFSSILCSWYGNVSVL